MNAKKFAPGFNRRYFGTDGIRGAYGGPVINEEFAERLGMAAARWLKSAEEAKGKPPVALIGRDTRYSGEALSQALAAGFAAEGGEPISLGVLPTPAVARAVRRNGAELGIVVTASHNPAGDNGIKFFGRGGIKLRDSEESEIEGCLPERAGNGNVPAGFEPGWSAQAAEDYILATGGLLRGESLCGWRIVLDTSNGATCGTSPAVFRALGAEVIGIADAPDGRNINAGVGSEHPEAMAAKVRATGARLGVAHDGDGDRCILSDEKGEILSGDEVMAILATQALARGRLPAKTLVVTVYSNLGVDAAIAAAGGRVVRTQNGDRYVSEAMAAEGAALGGEASGHIILSEISPAGDGLAAALKVIEVMQETGRPLSELRRVLEKFPQAAAALTVKEKVPLEKLPTLGAAIRRLEEEMGAQGRTLVRYSGTESKLRLMVEGPDEARVRRGLAELEKAARADLG